MANSKNQFYEVGSYTGVLREGSEICIQRQMTYRGQYADFKPFLNIPQKELEKRLNDSKAEEKKIYDGLQKAAKAWDEHGAQTLLLQKAIEYLKTPEVQHTANQWKQRKDGTWEISNLVYKMTYPGISPITRQENPTSPDLDGKSLGKSGNALEKKPRWKNICKAASMPMPTCSKKSHRLSRQSTRNAFASMVFCFPAIPWKPRSGHPRR